MASTTYSSSNLRAYFQSKRAGLDAQLEARIVEFIAATQTSLDCAIYDLRHPQILAALSQLASRPHVRLRIAFDGGGERTGGLSGDPKPDGTAQALDHAGLGRHATAVHEHGRHLMHDKFMVRDGRAVWVGSANMTVGGLDLQDNNCLAIDSAPLAGIYTTTFEEIISADHRHVASDTANVPVVAVDGARITPYFAPQSGEGIERQLIAAISHARRIRVMAFLIGDPGVLQALAPMGANPSFDIRGVYDPHGMQDVLRFSHHGGASGQTASAGQDEARFWFMHDPRFVAAPTHAFSPGREQDFMHNKVIVVDDHLVFTGSYNFSENAENNDETMMAIDSPALAAAYTDYFDTLASVYAREPVGAAVHAGARHANSHAGSHAALEATAPAALAGAAAGGRARHAEHAGRASHRERAAERQPTRRASRRASRQRTGLDVAITLVVTLLILTALALAAFAALSLLGILLL